MQTEIRQLINIYSSKKGVINLNFVKILNQQNLGGQKLAESDVDSRKQQTWDAQEKLHHGCVHHISSKDPKREGLEQPRLPGPCL